MDSIIIENIIDNLDNNHISQYLKILHQLSPVNDLYSKINIIKQIFIDNHSKNILTYVIKLDNSIVAIGTIIIEQKLIHNMMCVGHIEDIAVDINYRNRGLAKIIINHLINEAKLRNCYKIILNASDDIKGLYEKIGFYIHSNSLRYDILS